MAAAPGQGGRQGGSGMIEDDNRHRPFVDPKAKGQPQAAIFPIVRNLEADYSELIGTGFFITLANHFVSAKHVLTDPINEDTGEQIHWLRIWQFVRDAEILSRSVRHVTVHNDCDIGIGMVDPQMHIETNRLLGNPILGLTTKCPPIGSPIVAYGYPESTKVFEPHIEGKKILARRYDGVLMEHSEEPRDSVNVTYPYFRGSFEAMPTLSGAPVFDGTGRVFAVVTHSMEFEGGRFFEPYMARITELLGLRIPFPEGRELEHKKYSVSELAKAGRIDLVAE